MSEGRREERDAGKGDFSSTRKALIQPSPQTSKGTNLADNSASDIGHLKCRKIHLLV